MSFTRVAQQLQVQWRQLNTEEKRKYENTIPFFVTKTNSSPEIKQKQKSLSSYLEKIPNIELETNFEYFKEELKNNLRYLFILIFYMYVLKI